MNNRKDNIDALTQAHDLLMLCHSRFGIFSSETSTGAMKLYHRDCQYTELFTGVVEGQSHENSNYSTDIRFLSVLLFANKITPTNSTGDLKFTENRKCA